MPENAVSEMVPGSARALVYMYTNNADDKLEESKNAKESSSAGSGQISDSDRVQGLRDDANATPHLNPVLGKPDQSRSTNTQGPESEGKHVSFAPTPKLASSDSTTSPSDSEPAPPRQSLRQAYKAAGAQERKSKNPSGS